jgi:hypothetical protein
VTDLTGGHILAHLLHRCGVAVPLAVGAVGGHRVEGVGHVQDEGFRGDLLEVFVVIAAAVIAFVVVFDVSFCLAQKIDCRDDLLADDRVLADDLELLSVSSDFCG